MLELGEGRPEVDRVLDYLADPRYTGYSLARICRLLDLSPAHFFTAYQTARQIRSKIAAMDKVADGIVPVVEDVMKRAAPYEHTCDTCEGTGTVTPEPTKKNPNPEPERCETCRGVGKVTIYPELDRQKLALDLAQLLPKSAGVNILNQQNVQANLQPAGSGTLEKMQQALASLANRPLVLEADATEG